MEGKLEERPYQRHRVGLPDPVAKLPGTAHLRPWNSPGLVAPGLVWPVTFLCGPSPKIGRAKTDVWAGVVIEKAAQESPFVFLCLVDHFYIYV
ncbi:Hypothetical predicted protein [Olea europaea subsp. europaea]|uniref:Uncharacterized protein n=1 Tax=Olea europaea subsp. europaea TaxID=158383 RepID=A0A8S0VKM8_OLEEU|nr:Hypothetical predicted protein [Olea europaea subsp. europaea]